MMCQGTKWKWSAICGAYQGKLAPYGRAILGCLVLGLPTISHANGLEDVLRICPSATTQREAESAFKANGYFPADLERPSVRNLLVDRETHFDTEDRSGLTARRTASSVTGKGDGITAFWGNLNFNTIIVIHEDSNGKLICDYVGSYSVFDAYEVSNLLPIANVWETTTGYTALEETARYAGLQFRAQLWSMDDILIASLTNPPVIGRTLVRIGGM